MNCPKCEEELYVETGYEESEIVCYGCGWFLHRKFESADDAFKYLEANLTAMITGSDEQFKLLPH